MRKRTLSWTLVVAVAVGGLVLWAACPGRASAEQNAPAAKAPTTDKAPAAPTEPSAQALAKESAATKTYEKKIATLQDRLTTLQTEEMEVSIKAQKVLLAGSEKVKDPEHAGDNLFKGDTGGGLGEYKQAIATSVQIWKAFAEKLNSLYTQAKGFEREKVRAPKEIQPKIEETFSAIQTKYRSTMLTIADLCERGGDYRSAVEIFQSCLEMLPEKERFKDKTTIQKMATMLDKMKEFKTELQLLKAYAAANTSDTSFGKKIDELEKKYGASAPTTGVINQGTGAGKHTYHPPTY